jgi:anhydro-N-acetylmuramic acid kinase
MNAGRRTRQAERRAHAAGAKPEDEPRPGDRVVAGCMTGTSIDALDCAIIRVHGHGLRLRCSLLAASTVPLGRLADGLRRLAGQEPMPAGEIATLARDFALLHADALAPLHERHPLDLISVHGQTVFHQPPVSWQLFQPAPLAQRFLVPVVCDLRAADLANGGQGAPLTPLADFVLFRHGAEERAVVNLGGFCNLTRLPPGHDPGEVSGADVCACNQVLDAVARAVLDAPYDRDGHAAMHGHPDERAVGDLATRLRRQARSRRSLGTGDECQAWVGKFAGSLTPADLAASACAGVASAIATACAGAGRAIVAGGGVRNRRLLLELTARAGIPVETSERHGVPPAYREAIGWAVLGALAQDRIATSLPAVTGADRPALAGSWTLP